VNARDEILFAVRAGLAKPGAAGATATSTAPRGRDARSPRMTEDRPTRFAERAKGAAALVKVVESADEIPSAIADVLRSRNLPAILHLPPDPLLDHFDWSTVPGLSIVRDVPNGDDVAVNIAPYGIAETGTLVYPASPARPPSWHFRPGVEIALLAAHDVHADLESVLEQITRTGALPSTVNLVTGPSRTGDIEQTLELGAHGPKELIILIVPSLGGEKD
jgi:L-lactate dehydrogenase complex protein LldG